LKNAIKIFLKLSNLLISLNDTPFFHARSARSHYFILTTYYCLDIWTKRDGWVYIRRKNVRSIRSSVSIYNDQIRLFGNTQALASLFDFIKLCQTARRKRLLNKWWTTDCIGRTAKMALIICAYFVLYLKSYIQKI